MEIKSNDLEIIKQIETQIGIELKELNENEFNRELKSTADIRRGYLTDKSSRIQGLRIEFTSTPSIPLIKKLSSIKRLILRNVSLTLTGISSLKDLIELIFLDLRGNNLADTDVTFLKELKGLTSLNLSWNKKIKDVTFLKELKGLTSLDLSYNNLTDGDVTFLKELKGLTALYLSDNNLTDGDVTFIKELKGLTSLDLSDNNLTDGDITFLKELKGLTALYLRSNNLTDGDVTFLKELKGLTALYLSDNNLKDVTFLKELKGLTALDLRSNNLTDVDITFLKELKGLTALDLRSNNLTDVTFLKELKGLTALYLRSNNLTDITFIKELKGLTSLDLSDNNLTDGDITFLKELKGLTVLYLSSNNLTDVFFLKDMENLQYVDLSENPIQEPPKEIISQGIESIRDYFKALEGEKQPLKEVKVLLVGDGGAGKTSLLKQLKGEKFDKNEPQTHGINIEDLPIDSKGNNAKIHLWDFGGQEIMHASHQFFLSKRSLYILVTDCRKDDKLEHWLKHIRSFGGDSPVIVVINKIDQNPSFDVNRQHLQEKYKNIRGFYRLSCATRKGMDEFSSEMIKEIKNVEYMRTEWPKIWFDVKEFLQNMSKNYITYDNYYDICSQNKLTDKSQQNTLLEYLHNLGVILHFEDFELKDFQVLEPKWVTEAVYKIINSEKLAQKKGYLNKKDLEYILNTEPFNKDEYHASLKDTKYKTREQQYIISLMKTFELCYSIDDDDNMELVPDLLEVQEPEFVKIFDKKNALKFLYEFDFLPPSIIPRFIVKMNKDIKADDLQWRTGVVLEDTNSNTTAIVKADKEAKKISIYVNGEQKRNYCTVIRYALNELIRAFEKLDVKELVPLPDNEEIPIEYEELIGYENAGKDEYFIGKLNKTYSVTRLLSGIERLKDRELRYPGTRPDHFHFESKIEVNPTFEVSPDIQVTASAAAKAEASAKSTVNLTVDLPDIQTQFEKLKHLIADKDPQLAKRMNEIDNALYSVDSKSKKDKFNLPLGKLGNLMRDLGDEDSEYSRVIKGTKNALKYAQKIGRTYDKFAQWIPGLPRIPDVFLGKK